MKSLESLIDGVILTELLQINDERGAVLHMLRNDAPEFTRFGECYFSEVLPSTIKAWKRHHNQTQNLAVPVGRTIPLDAAFGVGALKGATPVAGLCASGPTAGAAACGCAGAAAGAADTALPPASPPEPAKLASAVFNHKKNLV